VNTIIFEDFDPHLRNHFIWSQFTELASNEFLLQQLRSLLEAGAQKMLEELPDGIHSGLAWEREKGIFFYFTAPVARGEGRRTVALSPSTTLTLKEHKEKQEQTRLALGKPLQESDLVFSQFDGSPLLPETVSQAWRRLALRNGLKGIRLHDARHTHASLMLKQGIHPKIVQERLGHSSIAVTLDTYSHVAPGLQAAAAKRFDELFDQRPEDRVVEKIR
jgi:integrase